MHRLRATSRLLLPFVLGIVIGCGAPERAPEPAAAEPRPVDSAAPPTETGVPEPAPANPVVDPPPPTTEPAPGAPAPGPAKTPTPPEPEPPDPEPVQEPSNSARPTRAPLPVSAGAPAARVEVAATKPGLTRIGVAGCKGCHKVQHDSWAAGAHAALDPPLDCESCHGPGSEYKALAIMKDPAKAKAAGLVNPGKAFCTASCHATGWDDAMLARAHAHRTN